MDQLKDKPFALIGVSVGGDDVKTLKKAMVRHQLPWRSFVDPGSATRGPIATRWNVSATPTYYLLDHKGVIRNKWVGRPGEKTIDDAVMKLLDRVSP